MTAACRLGPVLLLLSLTGCPDRDWRGRGGDDTDTVVNAGYGNVVGSALTGPVEDMLADGGSAFLCDPLSGLRVYDITEPTNPSASQTLYADDPCWALDVTGNRVFTATDRGFRSFSPNNMLVRGEYATRFSVRALDAEPGDNAAWLAGVDVDGERWLEEVAYWEDADMSSRQRVTLADDVDVPTALAARPGGLVLLDAAGSLHLYDKALAWQATWTPDAPVTDPSQLRMAVGDADVVYLSLGAAGVVIVDIRDLTAPAEVSRWPGDGRATYGLVLVEEQLYVGLDDGLAVLSVAADPAAPAPTGAEDIALTSAPSHIWVTAGFGFLLDAADGVFTIIDLD